MKNIAQNIAQGILLALFMSFMVGSLTLMTLVYTVAPNYTVNGKPVAILIGPLMNAQVGIVLFIMALVWLGMFTVVRKRAKRRYY